MTTSNEILEKIRRASEIPKNLPRGLGPGVSLNFGDATMRLWIVRCCQLPRPVGRKLVPPSRVDLVERIDENQPVPTNESTNMLAPDQWDAVLSRITARSTAARNVSVPMHC